MLERNDVSLGWKIPMVIVVGGCLLAAFILGSAELATYYTQEPSLPPLGLPALSEIEEDPCAGLELPGKYVPGVIPAESMILHFKRPVSREHESCIENVVGVEGTWRPGLTRYQIVIVRVELFTWEEIKQEIVRTLNDTMFTGSTDDFSTTTLETASCCIFLESDEDGGQPAQTAKEK